MGAPKTPSNKSAASPTKLSEIAAPAAHVEAPKADEKASNKSATLSAAKEEKKKSEAKSKTKKTKKIKHEVFAEDYYVPGGPKQYAYDPYQVQYGYQYAAPDSYFDSYTDYDGYGDYYGPTTIVQPLATIGQRDPIDTTVQAYTGAVELKPQPVLTQPLAIESSGLPPGSKIIAEYILGYLENEPEYVIILTNIFYLNKFN